MNEPKVIGIGFHKTGTSTLDAVFKELGYQVLGPKTNLALELQNNNYDVVLKQTESFDAFQDNPWPLLFKEFDKKYPGSKFILTVREDDKWINSIVNHFGETDTEMRRWIYGVGHPKGNENIYLERYRSHNKSVKDYFQGRENDLLIVNWENGDGWKEICTFLNKKIPQKPFPHANKGDYSNNQQLKFRIKSLSSLKDAIRKLMAKK
jgi:hypothetical protein